MNPKFDAIITKWYIAEGRIGGIIHADRNARFEDGELITTSPVQYISLDSNGVRIAVTKSGTRYLLA